MPEMWNCKTLWQEALLICTPRVKCFINRGVSCDVLHLQHAEADFLCLSEQRSAELGLGFASMKNTESSTFYSTRDVREREARQ